MVTISGSPLERTLPIQLLPLWGEYEGVEASLRLRWEGEKLYLRYLVREPELRRMVTEHNGRVWEDSCVEAFLQREGRKAYVNVECSASTKILAAKGEGRADRSFFPVSFIETIEHSVRILENTNLQSRWMLDLTLDLVALGLIEEHEDLRQVKLKGNFYCCGDKHRIAHYLAVGEIGTVHPDFHTPSYFVPLMFV